MNDYILKRIAISGVLVAIVVALGVIAYRTIVLPKPVEPLILTQDELENLSTMTISRDPYVLDDAGRIRAQMKTLPNASPLILSPSERATLMRVSEQ